MLTDQERLTAITPLYQNKTVARMALDVSIDDYRAIEQAMIQKLAQGVSVEPSYYWEPDGTIEWMKEGSVGTKLYTSPQAQATEPVKLYFPTMLRKMWSGGEVQDWLNQLPPMYITPPDDLKFRPDWSGVEVLAEELREAHIEMEALRKANIDCVNHFDAIKDDYDKAQAAMKLALEALKLARGMHYTVSIPTEDAIAALEGSLK